MDVAARLLGYSQPAISYQIKCLEQHLGVKLFERASGGVRLTADGERLLPLAWTALSAMDAMKLDAVQRVRAHPADLEPAPLPRPA